MRDVLRVCEACFTPKLNEHPIFQVKETPNELLKCPNYGSKMPLHARYCGYCGNKLTGVKRYG